MITPRRCSHICAGGRVNGQRDPITIEGFKTAWRSAKMKSGIEEDLFLDTRHTTPTRLMRATGNLKAAQKRLGHTEIATMKSRGNSKWKPRFPNQMRYQTALRSELLNLHILQGVGASSKMGISCVIWKQQKTHPGAAG